MSEVRIDGRRRDETVGTASATVAYGAADWLSLAAAPVFAIMALLTAQQPGGPADLLCSAAHDASPLGGMTLMYLLMSAFHAPPWLRLILARSRVAHRS